MSVDLMTRNQHRRVLIEAKLVLNRMSADQRHSEMIRSKSVDVLAELGSLVEMAYPLRIKRKVKP